MMNFDPLKASNDEIVFYTTFDPFKASHDELVFYRPFFNLNVSSNV